MMPLLKLYVRGKPSCVTFGKEDHEKGGRLPSSPSVIPATSMTRFERNQFTDVAFVSIQPSGRAGGSVDKSPREQMANQGSPARHHTRGTCAECESRTGQRKTRACADAARHKLTLCIWVA